MSAEVSLKISRRYHQIVSIEDCAKNCFKNTCTLVKIKRNGHQEPQKMYLNDMEGDKIL